jgi:hypothetical protein
MRTFRGILLGTVLSVIGSGVAGATTLTQTFTLAPTQTDISGSVGTGTFNDFLTECPTCQASWLTSVTVELSVSENLVSLTLGNTDTADTAGNTFDYQTWANLGIVATGASTGSTAAINTGLKNNSLNFAAGNGCTVQPAVGLYINLCDTGSVTYAPNQQITYGPISATDDSGQISVGTSPYDVAGTFTLGFTTSTHQAFAGGGGQDTNNQSTTANGTITVDYNYSIPTGAPEPGTLFLMGTALVGAGLLRKRIKS